MPRASLVRASLGRADLEPAEMQVSLDDPAVLLETTHDIATLDPSISTFAGAPTPEWAVIESDGQVYSYTGTSISHTRQTAGDMTLRLGPASLGPYVKTLQYESLGGKGAIPDIAKLPNVRKVWYFTNSYTSLRGWEALPDTLENLQIRSMPTISADASVWVIPAGLEFLYLFSSSIGGVPDMSVNSSMKDWRYQECSLVEADVDGVIDSLYTNRMNFTHATPELNIAGNNAAPSGTYQYAATPSTGLEKVYALVNDDDAEGFNTWSITYTAP